MVDGARGHGNREDFSEAEIENLPTIRGGGLKLTKRGWRRAECIGIAILTLIMTEKPKLP